MHVIDKVSVLNLPHQKDRRFFQLGQLLALEVPHNRIHFMDAPYSKDFQSGVQVKEAAKADGFAFFRDKWHPDDDGGEWQPICVCWGICRMLREIQRGGIGLMILDDMLLNCPFPCLERRVRSILKHRVFHALQLSRISDDKPFDASLSGFKQRCSLKVVEGFGGNSDFATVVTPEGADRLLSAIAERPWAGFATLFQHLSVPCDKSGFFSTAVPVVVEMSKDSLSQTIDRTTLP